ncbi:MAG: phage portal protein [Acidobacteriales bacterium]|nr:phage portal protein [Terriglobales bacterium]
MIKAIDVTGVPKSWADIQEEIERMIVRVYCGLAISRAQLEGDFSAVNYSDVRAGLIAQHGRTQ